MILRATATIKDAGAMAAAAKLRARVERAMQVATDKASRDGLNAIRPRLPGRLGNAIGHFSDKKKGTIYRRGTLSAASGGIFIRGKSERTIGAVISYTEGATITPKKGRWLWIATDQIQRLVGKGKARRRVTPALYRSMGLEQKVGPLKLIPRPGKPPLLVADNVGVTEGRSRSARSLTKRGMPRKGQVNVGIIAFYAIPNTRREQAVDVPAAMRTAAAKVNGYVSDELRKTA